MDRLNAKLEDLERKLSLSHRWVPSDVEFKECEHTFSYDKKQQLLLELLKASQRRMFLLKLKKKYVGQCSLITLKFHTITDGQKIAKKKAVLKELDCLSSKVDSYSRGATSLLRQLLAKISKLLEQSYHTVKVMNTNPNDYDDTTEEDHGESDLDPCSDIDTTDDEL